MAYVLGGGSGESNGFTTAIANFALEAMHESQGLVDFTRVVTPNQGDTFIVPNFAAITYQDYTPSAYQGGSPNTYGNGFADPATYPGAAFEQNYFVEKQQIQATPAVAATAFDVFYGWTTSFELAATIGEELGGSYGEKVDQRVCAAFATAYPNGFKQSVTDPSFPPGVGNISYPGADGFQTIEALSPMELALATDSATPANPATTPFYSNTVLGCVRNIKQNYTVARLPGTPIVVLDSNGTGSSMNRALEELTGGAVGSAGSGGSAITSLGEELLATGRLTNLYGCAVIFSNFLTLANRNFDADATGSTSCLIGAYFHETAIFTVLKEGLQIKMGEKPGGLQMWLTGLAYMGAGVADPRRGGAILIKQ